MKHEIFNERDRLVDEARDVHLRTAEDTRMIAFSLAMQRFGRTTWPLTKHHTKAPDGLSELERAFFKLYKAGILAPTSVSQLYNIIMNVKKNNKKDDQ